MLYRGFGRNWNALGACNYVPGSHSARVFLCPENPWPLYILSEEVLGSTMSKFLYGPFLVKDRIINKEVRNA
jgi:hypothetical protein